MMNKEKVIQALRLASKSLSDSYDDLDYSGYIEYQNSIENEVNIAIDELNSKPVMPKFFDRWIKENGRNEYLLVFYLSRFLATWVTNGINETDIREWVYADPYRFNMCIDAILNGYEVEK